MAYDDTSFYGDWIADEYDMQNNPLNPESPFGFYLYKLLGNGFDTMDTMVSQFLDDSNVLSCADKFVPIYGRYWGIDRPRIDNRYLTDKEYRVYLYLKKCRLLTIQDLEICLNNCMTLEDFDVHVRVFTDAAEFLHVVDHPHYIPSSWTVVSNIQKRDGDNSLDWIVKRPQLQTYNDLQNIINEADENDTVVLKGYFQYDESIDIDNEIVIEKTLDIVGDNCVIDGSYNGAGFYVKSIDTTITNCDFQNCYSDAGACVKWRGKNGVLENCSFSNSTADAVGGGVYWYGGDNGTILNCAFFNCSANQGGGVNWVGQNGTIKNSTFSNSNSYTNSGAINWTGSNGLVLDCIFETQRDTVNGITPTNSNNGGQVIDNGNSSNDVSNEVNYSNDIIPASGNENVHRIIGKTGHDFKKIVTVEVPAQGWDPRFLELLTDFISVKGNVIIQEYTI